MQRITTNMLSSNYLNNMRINLGNMQTLQSQLSSGKEISKPSDNPYKTSRSMQLHSEITANKQYNENIKDITNWLDTTDTALEQAGNVFGRVRELLVSAGNGTYEGDERKAIQDEIKQKVNQVSEILNTNFDGAYIFGGTKSTSKPVMVDDTGKLCYADKDGNPVLPIKEALPSTKSIESISKEKNIVTIKYKEIIPPATEATDQAPVTIDIKAVPPQTEEALLKKGITDALFSADTATKVYNSYTSLNQIGADLDVEISQGVLINYNKTATDILEYKDKTGATKNVTDILNDIIYNLNSPDAINPDGAPLVLNPDGTKPKPDKSKLSDCLSQMDSMIGNLLQKRSEVGAMTNRMESAQSKNESENFNMTDILSKTEDIDFTQKMMEYSVMQTVYMASLQTSAKILPTTILEYLR